MDKKQTMNMKNFDYNVWKLYLMLRETPKDKLPGLGNCPEYQELYASARENDPGEYIWFTETFDVVAYLLAGGEDSQARFVDYDMDDIPGLVMEEILTGKRSVKK